MTTTLIGEMRDGSATLAVASQGGITFRSTIKYLVATDNAATTREEVLLTTGLPIVGIVYGAVNATCISKTATRRTDSVLYWEVSCEFDSAREDQRQDESNPSSDPTTWFPVFKIDGVETKERVLTKDQNDDPIVNSAGDQFETPFVQKLTLCSFSFVQFEDAGQDIDQILDRNEVVNSTSFANRDARTLKLNVVGAELGFYGTYAAWRVSYRCTYDRDTWDEKVLDYGSSYLDAGDKKPYMDDSEQYKIYGKLDGSGGKATGDAAVLEFRVLEEVDFNDFIRTQ